MMGKALVLAATLSAASCVALAQYAQQASPAVAPIVVSGPPICDAQSFASRAKILSAGFDPTANPYVPPSGQASPSASVQQDLADAFSNAPPLVRTQLCGVTGVFINPVAGSFHSNSWGFRSRNHQDRGNTYIALSSALWPGNARAIPFHTYENSILQTFALWDNGPSINTAVPDDPWLTVLAALAHELGHVRWAITNIRQPGDPHDFKTLERCALGNGTTLNLFDDWTYSRYKQLESPNRWRHFGERTNGEDGELDHRYSPFLSDLEDPNPGPNRNRALYQLYRRDQLPPYQPWPSLFGAQTPEEQFVETYVLYALVGNKLANPAYGGSYLASLPVTIPGYTGSTITGQWADIPRDLLSGNKILLSNNLLCVRRLP